MSTVGIRVSFGSGRVGFGPMSAPGGSVAVSPQAASSSRVAHKVGLRLGITKCEPIGHHEVPAYSKASAYDKASHKNHPFPPCGGRMRSLGEAQPSLGGAGWGVARREPRALARAPTTEPRRS